MKKAPERRAPRQVSRPEARLALEYEEILRDCANFLRTGLQTFIQQYGLRTTIAVLGDIIDDSGLLRPGLTPTFPPKTEDVVRAQKSPPTHGSRVEAS